MGLRIINKPLRQLDQELKLLQSKTAFKDTDLEQKHLVEIKNTLSDNDFIALCNKVRDYDYLSSVDYDRVCDIDSTLKTISSTISNIKKDIEIHSFLKDGNKLDLKELRHIFNVKKLRSKFPNIDLKRLNELYESPPRELQTSYDDNKIILIDEFVFRKYLLAMIQMVFNHMDLLVCMTGGEGTGKSTKISQDMYILWWILTEIGIINYKFDINEMFVNTLQKFRETEDKYFNDKFRIIGLDEGNELNRQNWKDEEVNTFFQRLRRERFNQRIKFVGLPVIGEMIPNIVISRVNFIFDLKARNKVKSGTLEKGIVNMYIIPRGNKIYSPKQKREISQDEIKQKLHDNLKDKSYLKGLPSEIIIKTFRSNGTWGFKESEYEKKLKNTNESVSFTKGMSFSDWELFMIYKSNVKPKDFGLNNKDPGYFPVAKLLNRINGHFEKNADLMLKQEAVFKRKMERKNKDQNT